MRIFVLFCDVLEAGGVGFRENHVIVVAVFVPLNSRRRVSLQKKKSYFARFLPDDPEHHECVLMGDERLEFSERCLVSTVTNRVLRKRISAICW